MDGRVRLIKNFIKVTNIAEILGCSYKKASRLVKLPGFPVIKIGKIYYIDEDKFYKWCDENLGTKLEIHYSPEK